MSKTKTLKYRVEEKQKNGLYKIFCGWNVRKMGKPTNENLKQFREKMNDSFKSEGVNACVSEAQGEQIILGSLIIVDQTTNEIVAKVDQPSFEIV